MLETKGHQPQTHPQAAASASRSHPCSANFGGPRHTASVAVDNKAGWGGPGLTFQLPGRLRQEDPRLQATLDN